MVELKSPLAKPPAAIAQPCKPPIDLPSGGLSSRSVATLWAQDRMELALCGERHLAETQFYDGLIAGLAGR